MLQSELIAPPAPRGCPGHPGLLSEFAKAGPGQNPVLEECPLQGPLSILPPHSTSLGEGFTLAHKGGGLSLPSGVESDVQFAWKRLLCPDGEFWEGRGGEGGWAQRS